MNLKNGIIFKYRYIVYINIYFLCGFEFSVVGGRGNEERYVNESSL